MEELVFVEPKGREPYTTSEVIAECTGIARLSLLCNASMIEKSA